MKDGDEKVLGAMQKYEHRGFHNIQFISPRSQTDIDKFHEHEVRWIGDSWSWKIQLPKLHWPAIIRNRIDPVFMTSCSISSFPMDYNRLHFRVFEDDPNLYPLVIAHRWLDIYLEDILIDEESFMLANQDVQSMTGDDA